GLFLSRAGLCALGRRVVRQEKGQGGRSRHAGKRSPACHRDRSAAQWAFASAPRRGIPRVVWWTRLERRFPGVGACAPHPVQERHLGYRECRRRHRQGHRQTLHFCLFPMELGPWRRLHCAPGRHRRSGRKIPYRTREEILMIVRKLSDAKPYEAPNHRNYESLRLFGAEMGGSQALIFGISHFQPGGGAGPDASPPEKIYHVLKGELTVVAGGKQVVAMAGDSYCIAPDANS